MVDDYEEREDEDGYHYVYKGDIGPFRMNLRECYLCGSRTHWTMDCSRRDSPPQQKPDDI